MCFFSPFLLCGKTDAIEGKIRIKGGQDFIYFPARLLLAGATFERTLLGHTLDPLVSQD